MAFFWRVAGRFRKDVITKSDLRHARSCLDWRDAMLVDTDLLREVHAKEYVGGNLCRYVGE